MSQKFLLQLCVAIACIVPISAGGLGMLYGAAMIGGGDINMDSHFRYLSGLLFGIGLVFAASIPKIETHRARFRILTLIVFTGGLARLYGVLLNGLPDKPMLFGLAMELIVTPLLCLWQYKVASKAK